GVNPGGDNVTFTGILRGSLNNFGVNVTITGLDKEGWSPTFTASTGANFTASSSAVISVNSPTPYAPNVASFPPTAAGGGYTTRAMIGYFQFSNSSTHPAVYVASSATAYQWAADSTYAAAAAV